jgi:hypothetical protein
MLEIDLFFVHPHLFDMPNKGSGFEALQVDG